jgi:hypothetical protein
VGSREALLLYTPALFAAWGFRTGDWILGGGVLMVGTLGSVVLFYLLGGRDLGAIFRKLNKPTDYVLRVQAGSPHRVLIDQMFVSPVTTVGALVACLQAPTWLVSFVAGALLVHAFVTPKNVRFMLAVDIGMRMLCASLPGVMPWVVLGFGGISDLLLYRVFYLTNDPVTYDLVLKTKMFVPPEVRVSVRE